MTKRDYYEVLDIPKGSSDQDIKSAYRKLALKHHPDRNQGSKDAEEKFKEAAEAYAVLADPDKKRVYDRFGHSGLGSAATGDSGFDPSVFTGFEDILGGLGDVFGFESAFGNRGRGGPARGADLRYDLEITFKESANGTETSIQIPRQEQCGNCNGTGAAPGSKPKTCTECQGHGQVRYQQGFFTVARTCSSCRGLGSIITSPCQDCRGDGRTQKERKIKVKIPPGIATGQRLRLSGEGEGGAGGGPPGDLYVVIYVQNHQFFQREGDDLFCEVPVSFPTATLGGEITVPTLEGTESIKIPEATQAGATFRLKGQGIKNVNGRGTGDLFIKLRIDVPKTITSEQRKYLEKFASSLPKDQFEPTPSSNQDDKGLFDRVKGIFG